MKIWRYAFTGYKPKHFVSILSIALAASASITTCIGLLIWPRWQWVRILAAVPLLILWWMLPTMQGMIEQIRKERFR